MANSGNEFGGVDRIGEGARPLAGQCQQHQRHEDPMIAMAGEHRIAAVDSPTLDLEAVVEPSAQRSRRAGISTLASSAAIAETRGDLWNCVSRAPVRRTRPGMLAAIAATVGRMFGQSRRSSATSTSLGRPVQSTSTLHAPGCRSHRAPECRQDVEDRALALEAVGLEVADGDPAAGHEGGAEQIGRRGEVTADGDCLWPVGSVRGNAEFTLVVADQHRHAEPAHHRHRLPNVR